jgi:hypothetical protein
MSGFGQQLSSEYFGSEDEFLGSASIVLSDSTTPGLNRFVEDGIRSAQKRQQPT